MVTLKVIGSKCNTNWECLHRVPHTHCSFKGVCECSFGYIFDRVTDSCFRRKSYSERCDLLFDDCHNEQLVCSDYGVCICKRGFQYDPERVPYCQPTNSSVVHGCLQGSIWDPQRTRCVRQQRFPIMVDTGGSYDRNRYSLFFAILLPVLVFMIFLLKAKKHASNPFGVHSGRLSRNSYAEALSLARDTDFLPWNHLNPRLSSEAGAGGHPPLPGHRHFHHTIPRLPDQNANCCAGHSPPPPPPYSSTLNLLASTANRIEKPPSYEEAVYMTSGGHHDVNHNNNNNDNLVYSPGGNFPAACCECSSGNNNGPGISTDRYYFGNPLHSPNSGTCPSSLLVLNHPTRVSRHGRLLGSFIQGRERHQEQLLRRETISCPSASLSILTCPAHPHPSYHCPDVIVDDSGSGVSYSSSSRPSIVCENDSSNHEENERDYQEDRGRDHHHHHHHHHDAASPAAHSIPLEVVTVEVPPVLTCPPVRSCSERADVVVKEEKTYQQSSGEVSLPEGTTTTSTTTAGVVDECDSSFLPPDGESNDVPPPPPSEEDHDNGEQ